MANNDKILLSSEENRSVIVNSKETETPAMISNTEPMGEVKSSSNQSGSTQPWKAFDGKLGDHNSGWVSNGRNNQWISFTFPSEIIVKTYAIYTPSINSTTPNNFRFEGSKDGLQWHVLHSTSGLLPSSSWSTYSINNEEKKYKHYRLFAISNNASGAPISVTQMKITGELENILEISSQSEQDFINHGMSPQELSEIDFSSDFTEKHYIQNQSTPLGSGRVFEQALDINKMIKSVRVT